jgi:hypothetical protein
VPIGSWDPDAELQASSLELGDAPLQRLIAYSREERLSSLTEEIGPEESQALAGLMHIDHDAWLNTAETLSEDELRHLIRFFAVAENLPGWKAGERSPVIPLARTLRRRGVRLGRDLLQWLREVNDNRFLPYGPL